MKRLFYLMLAGILLFSVPSIAYATGSVEKEVAVDVDVGFDVCEQADNLVLTLSEQYSPMIEVKRSDGKLETDSYSFINTFCNQGESFTTADIGHNGFKPNLSDNATTLYNYVYRKARDGISCSE